ncbi:LemA family protein [Vibrio parahaemolyticus]
MTALIVFIVIVLLVLVYAISIYNKLVTLRNRFKNSFAQIEVQLKRRYDLIPNLVNTAKGYMDHEKETFERVIQARNQAIAGLKAASDAPDSDAVTSYNTYKQTFPPVIFANTFGFQDGKLLEFADTEAIQEAPKVAF